MWHGSMLQHARIVLFHVWLSTTGAPNFISATDIIVASTNFLRGTSYPTLYRLVAIFTPDLCYHPT